MAVGDIVRTYAAAWAEPDAAARAALLAACWTDDGVYCDPTARVSGRAAFAEHIGGFRHRLPGHRIDVTSGVDEHDGYLRFTWRMTGPDGTVVTDGVDFGELGPDGRLVRIVGFFGPPPAGPAQSDTAEG